MGNDLKNKVATFLSGPMLIDLRAELKSMRDGAEDRKSRRDLLWYKLCGVAATSGSTVHAEDFMAMYDERLAFDKLPVTSKARISRILEALKEAKVPRYQQKKAQDLSWNYDFIKKHYGDPEKATREMLTLKGRNEKEEWIRRFRGVGKKYSRDIWMDICDPEFSDSIAVDARVKSFAEKLDIRDPTRLEEKLLEFAKSCGLEGWELDRLIFNFGGLILRRIK